MQVPPIPPVWLPQALRSRKTGRGKSRAKLNLKIWIKVRSARKDAVWHAAGRKEMFFMNGSEIGGKDESGRREDLSFIVRFNWKTSNHLKEAVQVLLAARLEHAAGSAGLKANVRSRSDILDDGEFTRIRLQIASNPVTPPSVLTYLSYHSCESVLERVAENPRTPEDVLSRLSEHKAASVRQSVADNLNTPFETLAVLSEDENPDVRYRLSENPHTPEAILEVLVEDDNPYVSTRAQSTLRRLSAGLLVEADFSTGSNGWNSDWRQALG